MADPKEPKAKRTRGPNKNRVTMDNLKLYCEVSVEVLRGLERDEREELNIATDSKISAYENILAKINGNGGAA